KGQSHQHVCCEEAAKPEADEVTARVAEATWRFASVVPGPPNYSMHRTALRAAADAQRQAIADMKIRLFTIIALALSLEACCRPIQRNEPPYPKVIAGWKEYQDQGVKMLGNFVLRKDESIDNGKVQIRLLEVVPGNPCADAGEFQYQARAKLQFIRLL